MNKLRVAMTNLDQNDNPEVRFLNGGQKTVIEQMMPLIEKINLPKTDVFDAIDQEFTKEKKDYGTKLKVPQLVSNKILLLQMLLLVHLDLIVIKKVKH